MNGPAHGPIDGIPRGVAGGGDDRADDRGADMAARDSATSAAHGPMPRGRAGSKGTRAGAAGIEPSPGLFDAHPDDGATAPRAPSVGRSGASGPTPPSMQEASRKDRGGRAKGARDATAAPGASRPDGGPAPTIPATASAAEPNRPSAAPTIPGFAWMERMRPYRALRQRDLSIGTEVLSIERAMGRRQDALGDVIEVWNRIAPPALAQVVAVAGLARGTLTLSVAGSAASYELGRVLRGGLERALVAELPGRVRRVKVVLASADGR